MLIKLIYRSRGLLPKPKYSYSFYVFICMYWMFKFKNRLIYGIRGYNISEILTRKSNNLFKFKDMRGSIYPHIFYLKYSLSTDFFFKFLVLTKSLYINVWVLRTVLSYVRYLYFQTYKLVLFKQHFSKITYLRYF